MPAKPAQRPAAAKTSKKSAPKAAKPAVAARKAMPAKPADPVPLVKNLTINPGKRARVLSSTLRYEGPLFNVYTDEIKIGQTKGKKGKTHHYDVIRHNGSVVILAVDHSRSRRDPDVVIERQYRHAAGQFLYEVPAGKIEPRENRLRAAKRELQEETGYTARKWSQLTRYYASPGFLGEWMQIFLAEELTPGLTAPDEDESIELQRVPLSELLRLIDRGQVQDGKTLISVLSYARSLGKKK